MKTLICIRYPGTAFKVIRNTQLERGNIYVKFVFGAPFIILFQVLRVVPGYLVL